MTMNELHVGQGIARGPMTVFPIWGEYTSRLGSNPSALEVSEHQKRVTVGRLQVRNSAAAPSVLFEGQVLEGGWQNRMVARSMVVGARSQTDVDVVCVEEGRWGGGADHRSLDRRGSIGVRAGLRRGEARQGAVWGRVHEYEQRRGATTTRSFTEHADRAAAATASLVDGLRPLPGQVGLVVALAGQPVMAEVFGNHRLLRQEFDSIVRAAALDALDLSPVVTPARRARRFVERAARVPVRRSAAAGIGWSLAGVDQYVDVSGLEWNDSPVHLVLTNPRHELNLVGA